MWAVSYFWVFVFSCGTHMDYHWTNLENQMKCSDTVMEQKSFAITDVITDVMILLFPMPLIWRLQMSTTKKVAVTIVFFVGAMYVVGWRTSWRSLADKLY